MSDIVMTLVAERGKKYEETGQCISSHAGSIVFLPRDVKPDTRVRVRLSQIEGKVDARNMPMYRATHALVELPAACVAAIAEEARKLRSLSALPRAEGETALRVRFGELPRECTGFDWYYFGDSHVVFGSRFSPVALMLFESITHAAESGVLELIAWLVDPAYYAGRQHGREVDYDFPEIPEESLNKIRNAVPGTILARQLA